jgi:hypothetical protein
MRDIFIRLPTQIIRRDVTFELVGKTMDDSLVLGTNLEGCTVVYGMYGRILSFKSESQTHWKQIMLNLRLRCEKFGGADAANIVEHGYSDLGDENVKDRKDHWFLKVWPAAKDAPSKDLFHAMKMVCGPQSVRGSSSDLHANFCRDLSSCVLRFEEESIRLAVREHLVLLPAMNPQQARSSVKESKWKKKMHNFTAPKEEASRDCRLLWSKLKAEDSFIGCFGTKIRPSSNQFAAIQSPGHSPSFSPSPFPFSPPPPPNPQHGGWWLGTDWCQEKILLRDSGDFDSMQQYYSLCVG